jgi:hypothetical protein
LYLYDSGVWSALDMASGSPSLNDNVPLMERLVRDEDSGFVLCARGYCSRSYRSIGGSNRRRCCGWRSLRRRVLLGK